MSCVESFPIINAIQEKYKNDIKYLLIGKEDGINGIRTLYSKYDKWLQMNILHAFDSSIFKAWDISTCPRLIIVKPDGIVYAITSHLTEEQVTEILQGKHPTLNKLYLYSESIPVSHALSDTIDPEDSTLLFKSVLNKWNPFIKGNNGRRIVPKNGYYEAIGQRMRDLYFIAYFGQDRIGKKDSLYGIVYDQLLFTKNIDVGDQQRYCYRVKVPPNRNYKEAIMLTMQNDLRNYFNYEAAVEEKLMPCWRLTASKRAKTMLKTKGELPSIQGRVDTGFVVKNYPIKFVLSVLNYLQIPVIDETGIEGNIDIELKHMLTDTRQIQAGLRKNGLSLVKGRKKMKVLTISPLIR